MVAVIAIAAAIVVLAAAAALLPVYLELLLRYDGFRGRAHLAVWAGVATASRRPRLRLVEVRLERLKPSAALPPGVRRWALALIRPLPRPLRRYARRALRAPGWTARRGVRRGAGRGPRRRAPPSRRRRRALVRRARAWFARAAALRRFTAVAGGRLRGIELEAAARVGTGDAADTGMVVGALWALSGPLAGVLRAALPARRVALGVEPDFTAAGVFARARCILQWRGGDIMIAAWRARRGRAPARRASGRGAGGWPTIPFRV